MKMVLSLVKQIDPMCAQTSTGEAHSSYEAPTLFFKCYDVMA